MTSVRQIRANEWKIGRTVRLAALIDSPNSFSETYADAVAMPDAFWQGRAKRGAKGEISFGALAFDGDEPVGMAVGIMDQADNSVAYLAAMWVAPAQRGTNAAPLLVDSVVDWAVSRSADILYAGSLEGNTRALAFYLKAGFSPHTGWVQAHPTIDGSELVLSKRLERQCSESCDSSL